MDNFDTHKWFKKQYLEEGMSDEEIHAIKRFEELTLDDKLKLAKIQAMMDRERALREEDDDINEMDAPMHIEKLMDAAEMAYDAGMDVDEILGMIEQHLGLKMGDY